MTVILTVGFFILINQLTQNQKFKNEYSIYNVGQ